MPLICCPISPVAFAVCSARALTSDATTAKPRPASPARAASMVALRAKRLVCPAIVLISSTTSPMRPAALESSLTRSLDRRTQIFRRRGHRLHIGGGLFRGARHLGCEFLRAHRSRGERRGGCFEFRRGRRHGFDNFADGGFEIIRKPDHIGLALPRCQLILSGRFRLDARLLLGLHLEGL